MRADAALYTPFKEHFSMTVVDTFKRHEAAVHCEAHYISALGTQDPAKGYNTLPSTPGRSPVFWMQHRQRMRRKAR